MIKQVDIIDLDRMDDYLIIEYPNGSTKAVEITEEDKEK